ncbi:MAG: 50S ribosomal protein L30 [Candidatus Diapherotrites archaeon]|nr:50S ribosomal protein L30 [Candidatus Diapherotrites archaeon]
MIAAIRIRGTVHVREEAKRTLKMLNLIAPNNLVLLDEKSSNVKMLKKAENYITWGEISAEVLAKIIEKKATLKRGGKISKETLDKYKARSFEELAKKIIDGDIQIKKIGIEIPIRMRPPSKGYGRKGIKKSFSIGGALGYRGEDINELIERML